MREPSNMASPPIQAHYQVTPRADPAPNDKRQFHRIGGKCGLHHVAQHVHAGWPPASPPITVTACTPIFSALSA